jgi:para-aminobenzoate synthetase component 1
MNEETRALDPPGAFPAAPVAPSDCTSLIEELSPTPAPWDMARRLAQRSRLLFLDSAAGPAAQSRYSYVAADPYAWLEARGEHIWLNGQAVAQTDPLTTLAQQLALCRADAVAGLPPFQGGAAGLFGYDLCHHIERLPRPRHDEFAVPDLAIGLYDWVIAFDHAARRAWLISTGFPETEPGRRRLRAEQRLRQALRLLREEGAPATPLRSDLRNGERVQPVAQVPVANLPGLYSSFDRNGYLATIRRAIDYVYAGDCFQVNIAQRLLWRDALAPLELYQRLRERNPAPFAAYFDLGRFVILSASPERFLRIDHGDVETRPIKGTRPRGATPAEERAQIDALCRSAKDRAENVMIVDLLRNDLGRVCRYGSVRVEAVCRVETYQYVHHLVSVVRGRLWEGRGPIDALRAAFPGGSVTGAPKVRAMEIIAELEPAARGAYCGSLGWIGFDGSMDTNILIRTFTAGRGWVQFPVGGGIVADSVPEQEYEETWHKAEGLLRALK